MQIEKRLNKIFSDQKVFEREECEDVYEMF